MSSSVEVPSETTTLLADSRSAGLPNKNPSSERFGFSRETLLIPVVLATSLASRIPSTTLIEVIRQLVCRFWCRLHGDPDTLVAGRPPDLCDAPEVARYFAIVLAVLGATASIISIAGYGIFSRISSHYGRKPAFLTVLIAAMTGSCMIAASKYTPDPLGEWVLLVGVLFGLFSRAFPYLIDMYIVDGCTPEDRTTALSKISGWSGLGTCISYALGGSVTTKTGDSVIVFYTAAALYAAALIYVASLLPESFPQEKRDALLYMHSESSAEARPATTHFTILHIFEPLKMIVPTRKFGTRNWRLTWVAAHTLVFTVANAYAADACLVLVTTLYHLTPADTGFFFTSISVSSTITLMAIVPPLLRFLRPYYRRKTVRFAGEGISSREGQEVETSDCLHVHMAVASCLIMGIASLGAAASRTVRMLVISGIFIGISTVRYPMIRSLVAGSVDPLQQGEALAAIEMVSGAGSFLSPIIMGSILTATIETAPLLMSHVHLVVVLISSVLLLLVRDADRYHEPHE